jgi:hypothetical protein
VLAHEAAKQVHIRHGFRLGKPRLQLIEARGQFIQLFQIHIHTILSVRSKANLDHPLDPVQIPVQRV